ncbi:MAG: hypothetical protein ACI9W5_000395 [Ulvibacter sp.]|jgi:hypothetical protein
MILSADDYGRGCIRDNGVIESFVVDSRGYRVTGDDYVPRQSGGQQSDWRTTGYKADGNAFVIDIKGTTYINKRYGDGQDRCRICAKPKENTENKFKLRGDTSNNGNPRTYNGSTDNCLCTKIRTVGGIKEENLNNNPDLNHINIREEPTAINNNKYCPQYDDKDQYGNPIKETVCKDAILDNVSADSNWSCTDKFFIDLDDDDKYDPVKENIAYNDLKLEYINLGYRNKDRTIKNKDLQDTCYNDAGYNAYIGLFGYNGATMPTKTYHLYSEFYFKDVEKYRYSSPNNQLYPDHKAGEEIKVRFNDGYYKDNTDRYNIYFIEGVLDEEYNGILTNIVNTIEGLFYNDGALEKSYNKIVSNPIFKAIVRLTLTLYVLFMGFGILSGTMEISRKEFFSRILKVSLIIFFTSPDSWSWYNSIVVGFFIGSIDTMSSFTLNLDLFHVSSDILTLEQQSSGSGNASKFAFPDEMIKIFFSSENVFIKLWSLLFSPFNIAAIIIIAGTYIVMIYFIYIMVKIVIFYLTAFSSSILLLSLGPLAFILTVNKITSTFFARWLVTLGSRAIEIVMVFLVLYAFLSIINDKIGLYGPASPESLLYFESCPYTLFDLFTWSNSHDGKTDREIDSEAVNDKKEEIVLRSILSFFTIYVTNPTKGIEVGDGTGKFVGDKDFFEMLLIIMEVIILLYFLDMVISQIGVIASGLISYQQQSSRVNSAIGAISKEGSAIFGSMMDSNSFLSIPGAIGSAKSMARSGAGYTKRIGLGSANFLKEHDRVFRGLGSASGSIARSLDRASGDRISGASSYVASSSIGRAYSSMNSNEAYNNAKLFPEIKRAEAEVNNSKKDEINQLTKKYQSQGLDAATIYKRINKELKIESAIRAKIIKRVSLEGASVSKMQTTTSSLNTYFAGKDILNEINFLKRDPLLTNIEAKKGVKLALRNNIKDQIKEDHLKDHGEEYLKKHSEEDLEKEVDKQFKIKYLDNNFEDLLNKVIKENLSDKEIYKNFDIEHKKIVIRIMSDNKMGTQGVGLDITTQAGYNELQEKLHNDPSFKTLQRKIIAHRAHNHSNSIIKRKINYVSNKVDISFDKKYKELWDYVNRERHAIRQTSTGRRVAFGAVAMSTPVFVASRVAFGAGLVVSTPIFVASAAISTPFVAVAAINYLYRSKYKSSIGLSAIATGGGKDTYLRAFRDIRVNEKRQTSIKLKPQYEEEIKRATASLNMSNKEDVNEFITYNKGLMKKAYNGDGSFYQSDKDLNIDTDIKYNTTKLNGDYEKDVIAENLRNSVYHMLEAKKIYEYKQEVAKKRGLTSDYNIRNDADVKSAELEYKKQEKRLNKVIGSGTHNEAATILETYNEKLQSENNNNNNNNDIDYNNILIEENENFISELNKLTKK